MSELKKNGLEQLSDETLSQVAGGMSRNLAAAYDVMANKYGVGEERRRRLEAAGYNYWEVQHLVNGLRGDSPGFFHARAGLAQTDKKKHLTGIRLCAMMPVLWTKGRRGHARRQAEAEHAAGLLR